MFIIQKYVADEIILYYDQDLTEPVVLSDLFSLEIKITSSTNHILAMKEVIFNCYFINGMVLYNFDNTFIACGSPGVDGSYLQFTVTDNARDYIYIFIYKQIYHEWIWIYLL